MPDYPPQFILAQAMSSLDEDWQIEFPDAYAALADWFQVDGRSPEVLRALIADLEQLDADADTAARLARFPRIGWRLDTFDEFLRAIRKRAESGLAGEPEPMRAPGQG